MKKRNNKDSPEVLFNEADKQSDLGNFGAAFQLFKTAAEAGHTSSMNNLGYFYDVGKMCFKKHQEKLCTGIKRQYAEVIGAALPPILGRLSR